MRITVAVLLAGFIVAFAQADEFHIFTDTQGHTAEGKITSYDIAKKRIQIERKDGKQCWVSPSIFSIADQNYINKWVMASRILDETRLHISLKKKSKGRYGSKSKGTRGENICFEVTFENRTATTIPELSVEYKYFIKLNGYHNHEDSERIVSGSSKITQLKSRKPQVMYTKTAGLNETYQVQTETIIGPFGGSSTDTSYNKTSQEELEGIWIRVYGPSVGGSPNYRDITYPSGLEKKKSWK